MTKIYACEVNFWETIKVEVEAENEAEAKRWAIEWAKDEMEDPDVNIKLISDDSVVEEKIDDSPMDGQITMDELLKGA